MAQENPVVAQLIALISPIVSIGVGSAVRTVCRKIGKDPDTLDRKDLPAVKAALLEHYSKFWAYKMAELTTALK